MRLETVNRYGVRCLLAATSGLLLATAFPFPGWAAVGWLGPGLLLLAGMGFHGRQAFAIGYAGGLGFWLADLYWLLHIPVLAGAIAGWLALCAYLALYPAVWVWLCGRWLSGPVEPATKADSPVAVGVPGDVPPPAGPLTPPQWTAPPQVDRDPPGFLWPLRCAAAWVALEIVRAHLFSGFPWNPLGVSQYRMLPLLQTAAWTGPYGLSFLMVWFSVALVVAGWMILRRPTERHCWVGPIAPPLLALLVVLALGTVAVLRPSAPTRSLKVALIQPSIPQTLIWDAKENETRFWKLLDISESAMAAKPQLMIWPESGVPNTDAQGDPGPIRRAIQSFLTQHKIWLIFGAEDAELRQPPKGPNDYDVFNACLLGSPEGRFPVVYRKQQLVIMGEYTPRWLPFLKWFTPIGDSFASGKGPVPFRLPDLGVTASVLICFEDVFPHLARHSVEPDTDFLVNVTNDGWFGESAAQWQQAANAVFRAVENRIPLVRCANNGLTCWIDPQGRQHDVFFGDSPDVYQAGIKIVDVPLLAEGQTRPPTWYRHHGDVFAWCCAAATVVGLLRVLRRRPSQADLLPSPPATRNP